MNPIIKIGRMDPRVSTDKIWNLMPNILSSKKSLKKEREKRLIRIAAKKTLKRIIKEGDIAKIYKTLDSQLSKGIIKKNKRNRLKSRYAILANKSKNNTEQ